jgi:hypothetical protein
MPEYYNAINTKKNMNTYSGKKLLTTEPRHNRFYSRSSRGYVLLVSIVQANID